MRRNEKSGLLQTGLIRKQHTKRKLSVMIKRLKTAFILRLCLLFMLLWRTGSGRGFSISDVLIPDSQQDLIIKGAKTN